MKWLLIIIVVIVLLAIYFGLIKTSPKPPEFKNINMKITSSAFENNQPIPYQYTCDGKNINPPLSFNLVPDKTKSLVLIVDDPDAGLGTWAHWLVWNIDPSTKEIAENQSPQNAIEGINDFSKKGWGGPCPPQGTHRYQFKLYALDTILNLNPNSKKLDIESAMKDHTLDLAILIGLYKR